MTEKLRFYSLMEKSGETLVEVTGAATPPTVSLSVEQHLVRADLTSGGATVELPEVEAARGLWYAVKVNNAGSNSLSVKDAAGNAVATLNSTSTNGLFISTGFEWVALTG